MERSEPQRMHRKAIKTNGRNKTSTYHLNLTRTLADVSGMEKPVAKAPVYLPPLVPPYAGYDRTERRR